MQLKKFKKCVVEERNSNPNNKNFRYFDLITGLFVAVLLISNIASTKIVQLWKFTFDGGTILFPLSYIFGDILTEVYGYRKSRRVIWIGFFCALLMSVTLGLIGIIKPAEGWEFQDAYMKILGQTPRIVAASLIAYFAGEFSNSFVLAKMKIFTKGRFLWTRTIGSTVVGEGVDTILFVLIAFSGLYEWKLVFLIIISNYIFKVGLEVVLTPLTYKVVGFLKQKEKVDYFDYKTNFNPFRFSE
ncbi:MAG: queuosine precursor transporter [Candidatus Omnitrophica bacterium]|nr:queuosine precursor transporter [Candidatus Omnitrophota bacterium]